ncbi:imidazole glycerol phosphate synthase subunit HisH [Candidatus Pelagibacter ubique]|nr:imidazole glycerol phosphate synthase subunit HisH [Candidatus Pelagibacter ubique]
MDRIRKKNNSMIGIIDYGLGNVGAISNIYNKLKIQNIIIKSKKDFSRVDKLILPGVGAFDSAVDLLINSDFYDEIENQVFKEKKYILGICVGMQIFSQNSSEGQRAGLKWIDASVKKLNDGENSRKFRLPHMGWNSIKIIKKNLLFNDIEDNEYFYFCHSYFFECKNKSNILAETKFNQIFSSVVQNENIYGIQFHPEKSHNSGIKILNNFAKL